MKILVIYDSLFGNTEKIARAIAKAYPADTTDVKHISETYSEELHNYQLIIAGTPTHGGRPSEGMKKFLDTIPAGELKGIQVAAFDTGIPVKGQNAFLRLIIRFFGYAAKRLGDTLKQKGAYLLRCETFYVSGREGPLLDGETERAEYWASELLK